MSATLLVVDDDPQIGDLLQAYLAKHGYRVLLAGDGEVMYRLLAQQAVDLVILDIMLPGDDGLVLCSRLRAHSDLAILMLTANGEDTDRIVGLEMGADDYLAKPFNPRELLARIKAILRRTESRQAAAATPRYRKFDRWQLDTLTRTLSLIDAPDTRRSLGSAEFRLLTVFLDHRNTILSRDQLMQQTRGLEAAPYDRSIDVLVSRLRQQLDYPGRSGELIRTVRGEGYVLTVDQGQA